MNWPRSLGWVLAELNYTPEIHPLAVCCLYLCDYIKVFLTVLFPCPLCVYERERRGRFGEGVKENENIYESIVLQVY